MTTVQDENNHESSVAENVVDTSLHHGTDVRAGDETQSTQHPYVTDDNERTLETSSAEEEGINSLQTKHRDEDKTETEQQEGDTECTGNTGKSSAFAFSSN